MSRCESSGVGLSCAACQTSALVSETYFQVQVVGGFPGRAVDGSLGGEVQRVKEVVTLDLERAAQLQQSVTDPTRPVVDQLSEEFAGVSLVS